jgi:flagellar hook assembly protein FlgD
MSYVSLEIYDLIGFRIRTVVGDRRMSAGRHIVTWNGLDENGVAVSSGTYLYRLRTGDHTSTRKMILLK